MGKSSLLTGSYSGTEVISNPILLSFFVGFSYNDMERTQLRSVTGIQEGCQELAPVTKVPKRSM